MNVSEFKSLKVNDVVQGRFDEDNYYYISDLDVFGMGHEPGVYAAKQIDGIKEIRIDEGNCQFWTKVGRMKS